MEEDIKILENVLETKEYGLCEITDTFYKALEKLLKRYKELEEENNIITTRRRNGKTIELAMKLREEILKLPECRLYGIKNCKNKIVLLTKEECIPTSVIQKKIEEVNNSNGYSPVNKIFIEKVLNEILEEGRK